MLSSLPPGKPRSKNPFDLVTHHARAVAMRSPQGLRASPYLPENQWNQYYVDIDEAKLLTESRMFER